MRLTTGLSCPSLLLLFVAGCACGPYQATPNALERHIAYLASATLEGRDTGTTGARRAEVAREGAPGGDSPHGKFAAYKGARAKALKAHELGAAALVLLVDRLPRFEGEDVSHDAGIPAMAGVVGPVAGPLGIDAAVEE